MRKFIVTVATALAVAAPGVGVMGSSAFAQDVELRIDRNGPSVRMLEDCDSRYEDCRSSRREMRRERRGCTEDRALDKAERMGMRRARIVSAGRRTIQVSGRDRYGDRLRVTFGRERGCPVY